MKTTFLTFLLTLATLPKLSAQCQNFTLTYGLSGVDQTQGFKIIPTQDSNFVIAGEWNGEAFLLKVNALGQQLAFQKYGSAVTGQSVFHDVVEAPDGGFVAVGECENCVVPNDSLTKVIAIKTDANLNLNTTIGVKKFGTVTFPSGFVSTNRQTYPRILRTGDTYLLASSVRLGASINWEDILVTKLSSSLSTLWFKNYNTGYFEAPVGLVATNDGFIMPINRAFLPNASLLKINNNGDPQWIKTYAADFVRGITYLPDSNDVVVIGERIPAGHAKQAFLMCFDAGSGVAQDSLLFGSNFDDEGHDIKTLPNGDLLAGTVMIQSGIPDYHTSRIYQIKAYPLTVKCFYSIANGEPFKGTRLRSLLPISENGKDFVATGLRGIVDRAFFHSRSDCELTEVSANACPGDTYTLPDGTEVGTAGTYTVTIVASNGCDSVIQTTLNYFPATPPTLVNATRCPGKTYTLPNGQVVSVAGTYLVTLTASNGCDSVIQTILNYFPVIPPTLVNVTRCPGETYTLPNGQLVNTAGVYDVFFTASNGCDSLIRTTLAYFDPILPVEVYVALCPGKTYTLPNGQVVNAPGIYEVTLVAPNGCYFIVLTTIEGLIIPINVVDVDLCPGETYTLENGQIVDMTGTYDVKYTAENGCDSIVRTVVELLDPPLIFVDVYLCDGDFYVLPNGDTVNSGAYDFPYTDLNGCVGIQKIGILSFSPIVVGIVDIQSDDGQGNGSISLSGVSGGGGTGTGYQYLWSNGATTPAIDSLTFGIYYVTITDDILGCDAIFTYSIIVGVNEPVPGLHFRFSPNPFSTQIQAVLEVENTSSNLYELRLFDAQGRLCRTFSIEEGETQILETGDLAAGVYLAQLLENEKVVAIKRLVKQ